VGCVDMGNTTKGCRQPCDLMSCLGTPAAALVRELETLLIDCHTCGLHKCTFKRMAAATLLIHEVLGSEGAVMSGGLHAARLQEALSGCHGSAEPWPAVLCCCCCCSRRYAKVSSPSTMRAYEVTRPEPNYCSIGSAQQAS
jgi:hypothetical protein